MILTECGKVYETVQHPDGTPYRYPVTTYRVYSTRLAVLAAAALLGKINREPLAGREPGTLLLEGYQEEAGGAWSYCFSHRPHPWDHVWSWSRFVPVHGMYQYAEDYDQMLPGGLYIKGFEILCFPTAY